MCFSFLLMDSALDIFDGLLDSHKLSHDILETRRDSVQRILNAGASWCWAGALLRAIGWESGNLANTLLRLNGKPSESDCPQLPVTGRMLAKDIRACGLLQLPPDAVDTDCGGCGGQRRLVREEMRELVGLHVGDSHGSRK